MEIGGESSEDVADIAPAPIVQIKDSGNIGGGSEDAEVLVTEMLRSDNPRRFLPNSKMRCIESCMVQIIEEPRRPLLKVAYLN